MMSNVNRLEGTIKAGGGNLSQARRATARGREDGDDKGRQGQTHEESESMPGAEEMGIIGRRGQTHEESESVPGAEVKTHSECKKLISVLIALFKGL